jgi:hypothetical protein
MPNKLRVDCRKLANAIGSIAILLPRLHRKVEVAVPIIHGLGPELSTDLLQVRLESQIHRYVVIRKIKII